MYKTSKEKTDVSLLNKLAATASENDTSPTKPKASPSKFKTMDSFLTIKKQSKLTTDKSDKESNLSSKNSSLNECDIKADIDGNDSKKKQKCKHDRASSNSSSTTIDTSFDVVDMKEESSVISNNSPQKTKTNKKRKRKFDDTFSDNTFDDNNLNRSEESQSSNHKESNAKKSRKTNNDSNKTDDSSFSKIESKNKKSKRDNDIGNKKDSKRIKIKHLPDNPLPDVFKDITVSFYPDFISIPENERRLLERHWIAYGGVIKKSLKSTNVDYLVHNEKVIKLKNMQKLIHRFPDNVRHVSKDWLVKCINDVKLQDTTKFAVSVEP